MVRFAITILLLTTSLSFGAISSTLFLPLEANGYCGTLPKTIGDAVADKLIFVGVNWAESSATKPVADPKKAATLAWKARARYFVVGSVQRVDGKVRVTGQVCESATSKSLGSFKATEDEASLEKLEDSIASQIKASLPKDAFKEIVRPREVVKEKRINDGFDNELNSPPVLQLDVGYPSLRDTRVPPNSQNWHRDRIESNSAYPPSREEINNWAKGTGSMYNLFQFMGATPGGARPFDLSAGIPSPPDISNFNRPDRYYGGINDLADRLYGRWDPNSWTNAILTPVNTPAVQIRQNNPMPQPARPAPRNPTPPRQSSNQQKR